MRIYTQTKHIRSEGKDLEEKYLTPVNLLSLQIHNTRRKTTQFLRPALQVKQQMEFSK